jgi:hypothetical protein
MTSPDAALPLAPPERVDPVGLRSEAAAELMPVGAADFGREIFVAVVAVPGLDIGGGEVGMYSDGELAHRVDGCAFECDGDLASVCFCADILAPLGEPTLLKLFLFAVSIDSAAVAVRRLFDCGDETRDSADSCENSEEDGDDAENGGNDGGMLPPPKRRTRSHVADCEAKSQMAI